MTGSTRGSLEGLYQQVILDHAKEKHGHGLREAVVVDERPGSISQAATSVLHDLVVGHSVDEALSIVADYRELLRGRGLVEPNEDVLGDAVAFAGVSRHANRVKCAILGWTAFEDALLRTGSGSDSPDGKVR
jgi:nitrogen fixation protein NifU and related proteins